jgi:serine-type D-Ala-D-Ala carboxypeptidase (penicillin-binding protein 5/6)
MARLALTRCGLTAFLAVWLVSGGVAWAAEFTTAARQAVLIEASSGAVLYEKNADQRFPPASMSKLMTLAVVFKAVKSGQLRLTDEFIMSENAWRTGGAPSRTSAMMVPVNTRATLEELIQGIVVQSGNDAAIAIAEGMAGSEQAFAKVLTQEAKRIGLKSSTFTNSTGLHHPDHLMTAHDLARLGQYLISQYPEFYKLFAQREFKYRRHNFVNRNRLLFMKMGVDGLKTGYIKEAGYGVIVSAVQDDRRLIAVVSGLPSAKERWREASRILQWGFRGFRPFKLFDNGEIVGQARVWGGSKWFVPVAGRGDVEVWLPRFPVNQKLAAHVVYDGPLKPPIKQGDAVARLRVESSTGARNEVELYATEDIELASTWRRGLDSLFHLAFGWLP